MNKAIVDILNNDAALTTLIGANKVFSSFVPQEKTRPYVLVLNSGVDDPHTSGTGQNLDELRVRVWSISKYENTNGANIGAYDISQAVRTALHGFKGTSAGLVVNINFEDGGGGIRVTNSNNPSIELEQIYQIFNTR